MNIEQIKLFLKERIKHHKEDFDLFIGMENKALENHDLDRAIDYDQSLTRCYVLRHEVEYILEEISKE